MIPNRKTVVSIGLLVIAGTVQAATFINTCPFVITSPGEYLLAADLTCGRGIPGPPPIVGGITIASRDVTLRLQGHRITAGEGADGAILLFFPPVGPANNVRILGPGLITSGGGNAFGVGVSLTNVNNAEVSGITVLGSGVGISCTNCFVGTITANTFGRNGVGIELIDGQPSMISGNDASGNRTGIEILNFFGSSPAMVSHNIVNGNSGDGVQIQGPVTVQNNVVKANGQDGIDVGNPGSQVINNTSLANGNFDLFDATPDCSGNVWSGDTFFTANRSCIH